MKKHLLLFVCAFLASIAFSAAPAMAGQKLNLRFYNQHTDYTIYWRRVACDCISYCDQLPGGSIRPRDMWRPSDEHAAQIESKDTADNYCATQPSWLMLEFSTNADFSDSGYASFMKYTASYFDKHWHKYKPCSTTKTIDISCSLDPGSNDNLDIHFEKVNTGTSKQPAAPSRTIDPSHYYRLTTMFRGDGESLEGNRADSQVHDGAAFMDKRQNVTGQFWKLVPEGEWFRLKTLFQGDDRCLEGNRADSTVHNGAAFMDECQNVSGQLWKLVPDGEWFRLKTQFQGDDRCLEGNDADSPVHHGDAFMDRCQNVSGQLWKLEMTDLSSQ